MRITWGRGKNRQSIELPTGKVLSSDKTGNAAKLVGLVRSLIEDSIGPLPEGRLRA